MGEKVREIQGGGESQRDLGRAKEFVRLRKGERETERFREGERAGEIQRRGESQRGMPNLTTEAA